MNNDAYCTAIAWRVEIQKILAFGACHAIYRVAHVSFSLTPSIYGSMACLCSIVERNTSTSAELVFF